MKDNLNAESLVSGIIDGTGSLGAATGPLIVGVVTDKLVSDLCHLSVNLYSISDKPKTGCMFSLNKKLFIDFLFIRETFDYKVSSWQ